MLGNIPVYHISRKMFMKLLPTIIVLTWCTSEVHGCYCAFYQHPQEQFCSVDYALYGKVITEKFIPSYRDNTTNFNIPDGWRYKVRIVYKMKGVKERVGSDVVLKTPEDSSACGVRLTVNESYIILGANAIDGTKRTTSCNFIRRLSDLTPIKAFYMFTSGAYSYALNCRRGCNNLNVDSLGIRGCKYNASSNTLSYCLARNALCKRQGKQCIWFNDNKC